MLRILRESTAQRQTAVLLRECHPPCQDVFGVVAANRLPGGNSEPLLATGSRMDCDKTIYVLATSRPVMLVNALCAYLPYL
jgi:hypothetical protein